MNTEIVIWSFLILALVLFVLFWIVKALSTVSIVFVAFMLSLPTIIMLIVFVVFPPTLLLFLIGWLALIYEGYSTAKRKNRKWKLFETEEEMIKRQRKELGYDVDDD
ncbi:hypothetical protein [Amphritea pacifica]|uniref:hypothetical protein n=1 Tax=Amphritea pacifica TaxID=2811233 RepID=UPI0019637DCE|nr:hypothetical protein [Amphritea pacifica]MBN1008244.1 hypothetical protein [Amphritea pacifica]